MINIEIGTLVTANYGAMHPTVDGEVVAIHNQVATIAWDVSDDDGVVVSVRPEAKLISEIHQPGWRSVNGSPIGIFVTEA